jgi:hypothetical protein
MSNIFQGRIGRIIADSTPFWPAGPTPPDGAPNILVVLFDDTGFSDFGCYGSPIKTPTIDRLAAEGLRYTGLHTTAMCSTTSVGSRRCTSSTPARACPSRAFFGLRKRRTDARCARS